MLEVYVIDNMQVVQDWSVRPQDYNLIHTHGVAVYRTCRKYIVDGHNYDNIL